LGQDQPEDPYRVTFDTNELMTKTAKAIAEMSKIHKSRITTALYRQNMSKSGIEGEQVSGGVRDVATSPVLPDILAYLQNSTELIRHTLMRILKESSRLGEFQLNPQVFINQVSKIIQTELHRVTVNGIEYEKIGGVVYEMHLMEQEAERGITRYLNNLYEVQNQDKTLFNYVEFGSDCRLLKNLHQVLKGHGVWLWTKGSIEKHLGIEGKNESAWASFTSRLENEDVENLISDYDGFVKLINWIGNS
jgi:restriction endonuclease